MLILQGISFALFLLSALLLVKGVATSLPAVRKWRPTPSDKFAAVVHTVMLQVSCLLLLAAIISCAFVPDRACLPPFRCTSLTSIMVSLHLTCCW